MVSVRFHVGIVWLGLMGVGVVAGQDYPTKAIRIITSAVGGGGDLVSRLIAPALASGLGQQVIVDNRASIIAIELLPKAPPDGYTLLVAGSAFAIAPFLRKTPYDPVRDFSPVTMVDTTPQVLVVTPTLAAKSVKELIALAKAKPGELNYAAGSTGGPSHLAMELVKSMAGINIVRVAYKGGGPALIAVIGSEVQSTFALGGAVTSHLAAGRLRALGVSSAQPSALYPGVPTLAESGLPDYKLAGVFDAVFVPAQTPNAVIRRINAEIVRVLNQPDLKQKFLNNGIEAVSSSPQQLAATLKSEMTLWGKLIKEIGIRDE